MGNVSFVLVAVGTMAALSDEELVEYNLPKIRLFLLLLVVVVVLLLLLDAFMLVAFADAGKMDDGTVAKLLLFRVLLTTEALALPTVDARQFTVELGTLHASMLFGEVGVGKTRRV